MEAPSRWVSVSAWGRGMLLLLFAALVAVYWAAWLIQPWDAAGQPLKMGAHEQLGLPPCMFLTATGWPCPTCGMTTSFSLIVHSEWRAAFAAHTVGAALALLGMLIAPAALGVALSGWSPRLPRGEWWLVGTVLAIFTAVLVTWGLRLLIWRQGG